MEQRQQHWIAVAVGRLERRQQPIDSLAVVAVAADVDGERWQRLLVVDDDVDCFGRLRRPLLADWRRRLSSDALRLPMSTWQLWIVVGRLKTPMMSDRLAFVSCYRLIGRRLLCWLPQLQRRRLLRPLGLLSSL